MDFPVISPEQAFVLLYNALIAVIGGFLTSPVVVALVALVKFLPGMKNISGGVLSVFFATIATLVFWVAGRFGISEAFNSTWELLGTMLPAFLAFIPTLIGAQRSYVALRANGIPGVGSARTLPPGVTVQK